MYLKAIFKKLEKSVFFDHIRGIGDTLQGGASSGQAAVSRREGCTPYRFISATNSAGFAVISTQDGRNPLRIALRTDLILLQAAQ